MGRIHRIQKREKMKIILFQFLIFTQGSVFQDFSNLFQQLETLISSDSQNVEPGQLDYSNVFNDVIENRQDAIAKIIQTIENESEMFLTDLLNTVTGTFTDINMWFGDRTATQTMENNIKEMINNLMGEMSSVSLDEIRQNAIEIVNYIEEKYETDMTGDMLEKMNTSGEDKKYQNLARMVRDIDNTKNESNSGEVLFVAALIFSLVLF